MFRLVKLLNPIEINATNVFSDAEGDPAAVSLSAAADGVSVYAARRDHTHLLDQSAIDHGTIAGIADDDHSQYALLAGRADGQTLIGGSAVTDILKLQGTSGNGTLTSPAIQVLVGNNGATTALTVLNNGNVGIGTTSPSYKLDIQSSSNTYARILTTGSAVAGLILGTDNDDDWIMKSDNTGDYLAFRNQDGTAGDKLVIQQDGNVGIGTTSPVGKLNLVGAGSALPATSGTTQSGGHLLRLKDSTNAILDIGGSGTGGYWLQSINQNNLATNYPLLLNPNGGNVGIGLTSPTAVLHLKAGTATASTAPLKFTAGVLNTTPEIGAVEFTDDDTDGHAYITMNVGGVLTRREIAFVA